jgi:hypothetical protein
MLELANPSADFLFTVCDLRSVNGRAMCALVGRVCAGTAGTRQSGVRAKAIPAIIRAGSVGITHALPQQLCAAIQQPRYRRHGLAHRARDFGHRESAQMVKLNRRALILGQPGEG